jgi:hypothetical protein
LAFAEQFPIRFVIVGVDWLGYDVLKNQPARMTEKQIWNRLQYAAVRLKMKDGSYIVPGADGNQPPFRRFLPRETTEPPAERRDTVFVPCDTVYIVPSPVKAERKPAAPFRFALKTNLLYDALLLPNLTLEWSLGRQWSLALEGNWSWWTFNRPAENRWYHRIQALGLEARKWLRSPAPLQGHALGAYGMVGNYDLRFFPADAQSKGLLSYRSWSAGVSYGYSFPVGERLNFELGLALGYIGGTYYAYDYCNRHDHWVKRRTYERNYLGPTRVGLSLVWLLGERKDRRFHFMRQTPNGYLSSRYNTN